MRPRRFTCRIAALVFALGLLLGAAAPSWAAPALPIQGSRSFEASTTMPGSKLTQSDCMGAMDDAPLNKDMPRRNNPVCGMCAACALPIQSLGAALTEPLYGASSATFAHDVDKGGIATPPALPPPIA